MSCVFMGSSTLLQFLSLTLYFTGQCMMTSPPSQWSLQSPLISPHPMTPALHHHMSPLGSYSPSSSPQVPHSMSGPAHYFQWPQQSRQASQYSTLAPPHPPPPPPAFPPPAAAAAAPTTAGYYQQAVAGELDTSPAPYFTGQSVPQLPDFDSVFTPTVVVSSQS